MGSSEPDKPKDGRDAAIEPNCSARDFYRLSCVSLSLCFFDLAHLLPVVTKFLPAIEANNVSSGLTRNNWPMCSSLRR